MPLGGDKMGVRSGLLLTCVAATLLLGAGPMTSAALAQSVAGASTGPDGWWYRGYLEAGWRGWLNDPQRDGVTSSGGKSLAKYYEYSTIQPGPFLDGQIIAGTKDGRYLLDAWAKNVGYSDQRYLFDASKAGERTSGSFTIKRRTSTARARRRFTMAWEPTR